MAVLLSFIGLALFYGIVPNLVIPYAIIAGAYIIGDAIQNR